MDRSAHCPQTGKIYTIILFCLILSGMLISVNVISHQQDVNDNLFGPGVAITVIQLLFTLYLLYIDITGSCKNIKDRGCNTENCKWQSIAPPNTDKITWLQKIHGYLYIFIILLSSSYLMGFGITMIMKSDDTNDEEDITTLSIASGILGAIGLLFIIVDMFCMIGCWCLST